MIDILELLSPHRPFDFSSPENFRIRAPAAFSVIDVSSVEHPGVTGTMTDGSTVVGGVITFIGPGTYTPTTPSDWNGTAPTLMASAVDRCATLLKALNGGTGP